MAVYIGYLFTAKDGTACCTIPELSVSVNGTSYFDAVKRATLVITAIFINNVEDVLLRNVEKEPDGIPIVLSPIPAEDMLSNVEIYSS